MCRNSIGVADPPQARGRCDRPLHTAPPPGRGSRPAAQAPQKRRQRPCTVLLGQSWSAAMCSVVTRPAIADIPHHPEQLRFGPPNRKPLTMTFICHISAKICGWNSGTGDLRRFPSPGIGGRRRQVFHNGQGAGPDDPSFGPAAPPAVVVTVRRPISVPRARYRAGHQGPDRPAVDCSSARARRPNLVRAEEWRYLVIGERAGVGPAGDVGVGEGAVTEVGVDDFVHAVAQVGAQDAVHARVRQRDHS